MASHLIGFDSDGCVFDGMEIKHKECFCPTYIKHFALQGASSAARQAWEYVNLYSRMRGSNRFAALMLSLDVLCEHPDAIARGVEVPRLPGLRAWLSQEPQLGTPALRASAAGGDPDLALVSAWNDDANRCIAEMCTLVPAFPGAREALALAATVADLMVVSQAPHANLVHEWGGAGFTQYVGLIAGQESGTKARQLARAAEGRYAPDHMLMVGDAPGDLVAARENGCIFYPIIPGYEAASWTRFREEALPRFIGGTFDAAYQQGLMVEFEAALPCTPPWSHRADTEGP